MITPRIVLNATLTYHNATHMQDSPIFPLYTDVMNKGKPKAEEGDASLPEVPQPEVPQKQLTEEDIKELNLPTAEEIPTVPKQSLTAEDMQQMGLSTDSEVWIANFRTMNKGGNQYYVTYH